MRGKGRNITGENEKEQETRKRTPVRVQLKRLEQTTAGQTPEGRKTVSKTGKRTKKVELSPSQRKIESFFRRHPKVGQTGLSRASEDTNTSQGTTQCPLEEAMDACGPLT